MASLKPIVSIDICKSGTLTILYAGRKFAWHQNARTGPRAIPEVQEA